MILNIKEKLERNKKRVIVASVIGFLALLSIFVYVLNNQNTLTGKAVIEQSQESRGLAATATQEKKECSNGCNPGNILQFCSSGKWFDCPSEKVCGLGQCVVAESAPRVTMSGSSGGGGGGSTTTTTTTSAVSTNQANTYELAQIETEKTIEIKEGDAVNFNMNGNEYTIILESSTGTGATANMNSKTYNLKIGNRQTAIDYDSDSNTDFFVKIKSISAINGKVSLVIRK